MTPTQHEYWHTLFTRSGLQKEGWTYQAFIQALKEKGRLVV